MYVYLVSGNCLFRMLFALLTGEMCFAVHCLVWATVVVYVENAVGTFLVVMFSCEWRSVVIPDCFVVRGGSF